MEQRIRKTSPTFGKAGIHIYIHRTATQIRLGEVSRQTLLNLNSKIVNDIFLFVNTRYMEK